MRWLKNPFSAALDVMAGGLVRLGVSSSEVTLSGFIVGLWAFLMLPYAHYQAAFVLILINRLLSTLDGAVAKKTQETVFGYYLETVLDIIFYAGVFFCFTLGQPEYLVMGDFVLFSFVACQISRITLRLLLEKEHPGKRLPRGARLGGMMSESEVLITALLICLFPHSFIIIGFIFSALCWATAIGHMVHASRILNH